jgi:hypothetical protein
VAAHADIVDAAFGWPGSASGCGNASAAEVSTAGEGWGWGGPGFRTGLLAGSGAHWARVVLRCVWGCFERER